MTDKILIDRSVVEQVLEALWTAATPKAEEAIATLRTALVTPLFTYAKPPRGPLAEDEILKTGIPEQLWFAKRFGSAPADWTDEQIRTHNFFQGAIVELVRAIEAAHGITGETK